MTEERTSEITILNCDCSDIDVELVRTFQTMLVDPPYREYVHKSAVSCSAGGGVSVRDFGFVHLSASLQDTIAKFAGAVQRWSIVYSDVESAMAWRASCELRGAKYIRPIPWIRWSMPQMSGDRPTTGCEMLTCYWGSKGGRKTWNGPGNLIKYGHEEIDEAPAVDAIEHKCLRGDTKHKTEKPLDQMLDLVDWFSNPGDTVFDPCSGSGSTALACAILGRDFVGCELDPKWAERSIERVRAFQDDSVLVPRDAERFGRYLAAKTAREKAGFK